MAASIKTATPDLISKLTAQYGCGPVRFSGADEALYERHLLFDNIVDAKDVTLRERYEAIAHSVRDLLSQRWIRTEQTYERDNPKRIYYLSIEFLLGRSLSNNITNLMLDPIVAQLVQEKSLDWLALL
jgi:glycogen phosphorylase